MTQQIAAERQPDTGKEKWNRHRISCKMSLIKHQLRKVHMKNILYTPATATPFLQNKNYMELCPRTPELARYIRCFWGTKNLYEKQELPDVAQLVIPDTCVDIIYEADYTENTVTSSFCGINDSSFFASDRTKRGYAVSLFAIRFYAWTAYAFSEDSLKNTVNGWFDAASRFFWLDKELRQIVFEKHTLAERSRAAEKLFAERMEQTRENDTVNQAVKQIISANGSVDTAGLAKECFISTRQMERLFHEYIGMTPKKLCNLVRYQFLWNEIIKNPGFCIQDAVYKYGYTDQSHLMREFKRYHSMDIKSARQYAARFSGQ